MKRALLLVALAAGVFPAAAQNWTPLLKDTPAERFDEEDLRLFKEAARKTLESAPPGQVIAWDNPKTRRSGEFKLLREFKWKGLPCKEVQVRTEGDGRHNEAVRYACRKDGRWRLASPTQLKAK